MKIVKVPKYIEYEDDDCNLCHKFVGYEDIRINNLEDELPKLDKDSNKLYQAFYEKYGRDFDPLEDDKNLILSLKESI